MGEPSEEESSESAVEDVAQGEPEELEIPGIGAYLRRLEEARRRTWRAGPPGWFAA
ncbi:hypothetical protein [Streptomyces noursei]